MPIKIKGLEYFDFIETEDTWDWYCKQCRVKAEVKYAENLIYLKCPKCGEKEVIGSSGVVNVW